MDRKWQMDGKFQPDQSCGRVAEVKPKPAMVDAARKTRGRAFLLLAPHISWSRTPLSGLIQNKSPHNRSKFVSRCFFFFFVGLLVNVHFGIGRRSSVPARTSVRMIHNPHADVWNRSVFGQIKSLRRRRAVRLSWLRRFSFKTRQIKRFLSPPSLPPPLFLSSAACCRVSYIQLDTFHT